MIACRKAYQSAQQIRKATRGGVVACEARARVCAAARALTSL
ncbi:hypothetical protein J2W71_002789 [Pseudomonas sp. 3400]|nr:hypothetical protein [Pseudomonas sp. 3400]MDR7011780.1 hypothetical protein [Pseudomonas alcaliphila]